MYLLCQIIQNRSAPTFVRTTKKICTIARRVGYPSQKFLKLCCTATKNTLTTKRFKRCFLVMHAKRCFVKAGLLIRTNAAKPTKVRSPQIQHCCISAPCVVNSLRKRSNMNAITLFVKIRGTTCK
jgi:hypothetical protein